MTRAKDRRDQVREGTATYGVVEVPASDLKNDWHHWLDQVARGRQTLIVTRYGTPVARLIPVDEPASGSVVGALAGRVVFEGELVEPTGDRWDAES